MGNCTMCTGSVGLPPMLEINLPLIDSEWGAPRSTQIIAPTDGALLTTLIRIGKPGCKGIVRRPKSQWGPHSKNNGKTTTGFFELLTASMSVLNSDPFAP